MRSFFTLSAAAVLAVADPEVDPRTQYGNPFSPASVQNGRASLVNQASMKIDASQQANSKIAQTVANLVKADIKAQKNQNTSTDDEDAIDSAVASKSLAAGWANSMVNAINGYACWCYFEDDHGRGKGQAQNDVDSQCKILHDGYACIMMDAEDSGDICVPWQEDYNVPTGLGWWSRTGTDEEMKAALVRDCNKKNKKKSDCAKRSCIVEGYFSINLFKLLTSGTKYDHRLKHEYNKFDPKLECQSKPGNGDLELECCGSYPIRFPYKYGKDVRECCNGNTFNAAILKCCDDGKVRIVCD